MPGTPGLLKQVQPFHKAGTLRCGRSAVFPTLTTPDDVDLEGVAGDRKAHPVPGTCLGLIALPENGSCAFVLLDDVLPAGESELSELWAADRTVGGMVLIQIFLVILLVLQIVTDLAIVFPLPVKMVS